MTSRSGKSGGVRFSLHPRKDLLPEKKLLEGVTAWESLSPKMRAAWEASARAQLDRSKRKNHLE